MGYLLKCCLGLLPLCLRASGQGARVDVEAGVNMLSAAIDAANTNTTDTLILSNGTVYTELKPINITKSINIFGSVGAKIKFDTDEDEVLHHWNVSGTRLRMGQLSIANKLHDNCTFLEPFADMSNTTLQSSQPSVRQNKLFLNYKMTPIYATRTLVELGVGSCSMSKSPWIKNDVMAYSAKDCSSRVSFSLDFDRIGNCDVKISTFPDRKRYEAVIYVIYLETVFRDSLLRPLTQPQLRAVTFLSKIAISIDRQQTVASEVRVTYNALNITMVITDVHVKLYDANGRGVVTLQVETTSPYMLTNGTTQSVEMVKAKDNSSSAVVTSIEGTCNNLGPNDTCVQKIIVSVSACDLTATYTLSNINVTCQDSAWASDSCPGGIPTTVDMEFDVATNRFCNSTEINIKDSFKLIPVLRADDTYTTQRVDNKFLLGDLAYISLVIDTSSTGIAIENAVMTRIFRNVTNSSCDGYDWAPANDIKLVNQSFNPTGPSGPQVQFPTLLNTVIACAKADALIGSLENGTGSEIVLNMTVLVDYVDSTTGRRRRQTTNTPATISGERDAAQPLTIRQPKPPPEISTNATTTAENTGSGNSNLILFIIIGSVSGIFLCCCSCITIVCLRGRARKRREKEAELKRHMANQNLAGGYNPNFPNYPQQQNMWSTSVDGNIHQSTMQLVKNSAGDPSGGVYDERQVQRYFNGAQHNQQQSTVNRGPTNHLPPPLHVARGQAGQSGPPLSPNLGGESYNQYPSAQNGGQNRGQNRQQERNSGQGRMPPMQTRI